MDPTLARQPLLDEAHRLAGVHDDVIASSVR